MLTGGSRTVSAAADVLLGRVPTRAVAAPDGTRLERGQPLVAAGEIDVGGIVIHMEPGATVHVHVARR